jgi:hypothetical protein
MYRRTTISVATMTAAVLGFGAAASVASHGEDAIWDALECANAPAGVWDQTDENDESADDDDSDRGMVCVSDGDPANGAEYYLGGEGQTETAYPDAPDHQAGDPCGAIVSAGEVLSATRPDDPATPEDERLDWDWTHTHDDGSDHHHTCD